MSHEFGDLHAKHRQIRYISGWGLKCNLRICVDIHDKWRGTYEKSCKHIEEQTCIKKNHLIKYGIDRNTILYLCL